MAAYSRTVTGSHTKTDSICPNTFKQLYLLISYMIHCKLTSNEEEET